MTDEVEGARRVGIKLPAGEVAGLAFGDPARPVDVLFAHANGFNARTYRSVLAPLGERLHVLAVDLRGHGRTTLPAPGGWRRSWDLFGEDLAAVLDALDGPPLILAGHSMGGTSSVLAAALRPGRVSGLALFDPVVLPAAAALYARAPWTSGALWRDTPMAKGALKRRAVFPDRASALASYLGRGAFKTWPQESVADYVADGFRDLPTGEVELACSPEWEAANYAAQGHDVWGAARSLTVPIRIWRAEHGSTFHGGDGFGDRRDVQVQTIPGSSHFLPLERPDVVQAALLGIVG